MSNKEVREFSEKLKNGLQLAERRMLEEKALRGEEIIVSYDGKNFKRIPAKLYVNSCDVPCQGQSWQFDKE